MRYLGKGRRRGVAGAWRDTRRTGRRGGVTLIIVVGVLAVLATLGSGFYTLMNMQTQAATRQADAVRAGMLARAGRDYAIGRMRKLATEKPEDASYDPVNPANSWYPINWLRGGSRSQIAFAPRSNVPFSAAIGDSVSAGEESDRFTLQIEDAASKINVNAGENLAVMLDNLCRLIGPPLVAANQDKLLQMRWRQESYVSSSSSHFWPSVGSVKGKVGSLSNLSMNDTGAQLDIYYWLYDRNGTLLWQNGNWNSGITDDQKAQARPPTTGLSGGGQAVFGDGYAIAGYRSRIGRFRAITDIKDALTVVKRVNPGSSQEQQKLDQQLEDWEREVKFALLRPYITLNSWVDTTTVCTGKFEWASSPDPIYGQPAGVPIVPDKTILVRPSFGGGEAATFQNCQILIDRDKSWVADDPTADPHNRRGSLRGCYIAIVNGHGAGQLRRIATNGTDWVAIRAGERMTVPPGPISSYMIYCPEDAILRFLGTDPSSVTTNTARDGFPEKLPPVGQTWVPYANTQGVMIDYYAGDPTQKNSIEYTQYPLCIHRAPVNINTASDKVLAALFMGLSVQQGHPMALGTDTNRMNTEKITGVYTGMGTLTQRVGNNVLPMPDYANSPFPKNTFYAFPLHQYYDTLCKLQTVPYITPCLWPLQTFPQYWYSADPLWQETRLLTPAGLRRTPMDAGKLLLERPAPWKKIPGDSWTTPGDDSTRSDANFNYLTNYTTLRDRALGNFEVDAPTTAEVNEAHELAYRILQARQVDPANPALRYIDVEVDPDRKYDGRGQPTSRGTDSKGHILPLRGPFLTWDDFYFRVVRPWDDARVYRALLDPVTGRDLNGNHKYDGWVDVDKNGLWSSQNESEMCSKTSLARMLMSHFNPNTDLLKFNPNIEWIDRYGRNFTELEPVMIYSTYPVQPAGAGGSWNPKTLYGTNGDVHDGGTDCTSWIGLRYKLCLDSGAGYIDNTARPVFLAGYARIQGRTTPVEATDFEKFQQIYSGCQFREHGSLVNGGYMIRNFRYKSDEMIDKSDLNRSTTEFSFDSNGIYEIYSTGQVVQPRLCQLVAERKQYYLVKIYDVWRETTQEQFCQGVLSDVPLEARNKDWAHSVGGSNIGDYTGRVTRDASPYTSLAQVRRKALVTAPEPVVPLVYTIENARNREVVDTRADGPFTRLSANQKRDAYGRPVRINIPDVIANGVQPARWDGQVLLATNDTSWDPTTAGDYDTFRAGFVGDLDTDTAGGNGHEQAKAPGNATLRVVHTISLLGLMNDHEVVMDPGLPDGPDNGSTADHRDVFGRKSGQTSTFNAAYNTFPQYVYWMETDPGNEPRLKPTGAHSPFNFLNWCLDSVKLNEKSGYWNNVTVRQGDLRPDGVWLGSCGVSGKAATLKYLFDHDENNDGKEDGILRNADGADYSGNDAGWGVSSKCSNGVSPYAGSSSPNGNRVEVARRNFNPGSPYGNLVTLWYKTAWRHDDNRHHEFFNASNPITRVWFYSVNDTAWRWKDVGRPCLLAKAGRYWYAPYESDIRLNQPAGRNYSVVTAPRGNPPLTQGNSHMTADMRGDQAGDETGLNLARAKNNDLLMAVGGNCDLFPAHPSDAIPTSNPKPPFYNQPRFPGEPFDVVNGPQSTSTPTMKGRGLRGWSEACYPHFLDSYDQEMVAAVHGGTSYVKAYNSFQLWRQSWSDPGARPLDKPESSSYRIQPFRWGYLGMRWRYPDRMDLGQSWTTGKDLSKTKPLTPRMKSCQNIPTTTTPPFFPGEVSGFLRSTKYMPQTPGRPLPFGQGPVFRRFFITQNVRCCLDWTLDFRTKDETALGRGPGEGEDFYMLPGRGDAGFYNDGHEEGKSPGWWQVTTTPPGGVGNGKIDNNSLRPFYYGDFMGAWGRWRRPILAPEKDSAGVSGSGRSSLAALYEMYGRVPPAMSIPAHSNSGSPLAYELPGPNGMLLTSYNPHYQFNRSFWLPILFGDANAAPYSTGAVPETSAHWAAGGEYWYSTSTSGSAQPPFIAATGPKKPPNFIQYRDPTKNDPQKDAWKIDYWLAPPFGKLARQPKWLIGDHFDNLRFRFRPFLDSQRHPEGPEPTGEQYSGNEPYKAYEDYWSLINWRKLKLDAPCDIGNPGPTRDTQGEHPHFSTFFNAGRTGQDVKYYWADPADPPANAGGGTPPDPGGYANYSHLKCFSINNFNAAREYFKPIGGTGMDPYVIGRPQCLSDIAMHMANHTYVYRSMMPWLGFEPENLVASGSINRQTPGMDGTYAVISELKISSRERALTYTPIANPSDAQKAWWPSSAQWTGATPDRAYREMHTSRYYLPPDPNSRDSTYAPTFTSQSLFNSLKGQLAASQATEYVTVVRVSWNVFTPRFMHEYRTIPSAPRFTRREFHTEITEPVQDWTNHALCFAGGSVANPMTGAANQTRIWVPSTPTNWTQNEFSPAGAGAHRPAVGYRGPFDFDAYNPDPLLAQPGDQMDYNGRYLRHLGAERPTSVDYTSAASPYAQPHATQGVEVEVLNLDLAGAGNVIPGSFYDHTDTAGTPYFRDSDGLHPCGTFFNPAIINRFVTSEGHAVTGARVRADRLKYRVRFRYPVDNLVDPHGGTTVNPATAMLLDTPVFDDISIVYLPRVVILDYSEVTD